MVYEISLDDDFFNDATNEVRAQLEDTWRQVADKSIESLMNDRYDADRRQARYTRTGALIKRADIYPVDTGRARRGFSHRQTGLTFEIRNREEYVQYIEARNNDRQDGGRYLDQFFRQRIGRIIEEIG